MKMC